MALQKAPLSSGQKSWPYDQKCSNESFEVIVGRDLEKPGVVKARVIAKQKRGLVCRDPVVSHAEKRSLSRYLRWLLVGYYSIDM